MTGIAPVVSKLIHQPPLCVFAAYISIGEIEIPRDIFEAPEALLDFVHNGFQSLSQLQQDRSDDQQEEAIVHTADTCTRLRWQDALSVLQQSSSTLAERLSFSNENNVDYQCNTTPIRFRASFDRGDIQHKGVRSQDLAAGLGGVTGRLFPSWKVDLKNFDIEVMGRWIQNVERQDDQGSHSAGQQESSPKGMRMQVGVALPLALSTCPYRFRPIDGRTSLRIEIAFTLLALVSPQPGDIVMDLCSGVGTFPVVGAIHYPKCMFVGSEILPHNVDSAVENMRGMTVEIMQQETLRLSSADLLVGDARAVCWRSGTVDVIVSDLPWGQRESSHHYNCKLYPKLIREVIRLLRVGGRAVLVTGERKLLQRQLDAPFAKPYLQVVAKREITIGFKVLVFEMVRIAPESQAADKGPATGQPRAARGSETGASGY
ncbi:S-adenosyl-L-methionine-dependent methyltransferase [Mortierella sp. GBAus27b]|nr:S-adenosyl-L-methionine-dependent methyltransferase [Mortierella sp. GBAus27b]